MPEDDRRTAKWVVGKDVPPLLFQLPGMGGLYYAIPGEDGSVGLLYGRPMFVDETIYDPTAVVLHR